MEEIIINDIQSFLILEHNFLNQEDEIWYRGQANFDRGLDPSFLRLVNNSELAEKMLFDIFVQNSSTLIETPTNPLDWMFIMQHYGIPTRLLDWTENPLVALYFAVEKYKNEKDGALWLLKPKKLNQPVLGFPTIPMYDNPNVSEHMKGQSQYPKTPIAILATRNNSRIQIQEGVFTIHINNNEKIESACNDYLLKIKIPADSKEKIFTQLKLLGINKFRLFPELSNIKDLMEHKKLLERKGE